MPLTPQQAEQVHGLLAGLPLAGQVSAFLRDLASVLTAVQYPARSVFFNAGTPADALYLLVEGRVVQTLGDSGQPWYQKPFERGEFFGQHGLLGGQQQLRAVALTDVIVYQMPVSALRLLLDRYPGFQEILLSEKRAARLRSIPLFASLTDAEIRWLAQSLADVRLQPGQAVPLAQMPGLWVIDWGQVQVAGPAAMGRAGWCLTAGNFFASPGSGACAADQATAVRETALYRLPEPDFQRLVAAFPDVCARVSRPLDPAVALAGVPLCRQGMSDLHRQHLAQCCAWHYVPAGQNLISQGEVGYSLMMLLDGAAMVSAVNDQGRLRPRNLLRPGDYIGETALLQGKPHDVTVRAVNGQAGAGQPVPAGAEILSLDRRDLNVAFKERPDLWHSGIALYDEFAHLSAEQPRYAWQEEGEVLIWSGRRHPFWLAAPLGTLALACLILFSLLLAIDWSHASVLGFSLYALKATILSVPLLIFLPVAFYITLNYLDDYYVVTNRRVTRRDRQLLIRESRTDAPLDMVQDVTIDTILAGRLTNFGNLTIHTAAKAGAITFVHVPDPQLVKEHILREKAGVAAALRGRNREMLRKGLIDGLRITLTVPDADKTRALGEKAEPRVEPALWEKVRRRLQASHRPAPVTPPGTHRRRWLRNLTSPLPDAWRDVLVGPPPAPPRQASGEIVWRKHWVNLLLRSGGAVLTVVGLLAAGVVLFVLGRAMAPDLRMALLLPWLLLVACASGWMTWEFVDYRNDVYVVTDDKIIDIKKRPLALSMKQRESSLRNIQTVFAEQNGLLANLLDYGDVVIRTAAADEGFIFEMVPAPKVVQQTIFQKLDAFRRRDAQRELLERQRAIIEGLEVYHDLRDG